MRRMTGKKYCGYDGADWIYSNTIEYDPTTDTYYMLIGDDCENDDHWVMVNLVSIVEEGDE